MKLDEGLQKHGFRKWYERQLLQSHAHLTLCFLCVIGIFAAIEALMRFRGWQDQLIDLLAVAACVGVGLWALRRYLFLLHHAEYAAHQAECRACGTYGRLTLMPVRRNEGSVPVSCKKCGHAWDIDV